jgi:actin-related protein
MMAYSNDDTFPCIVGEVGSHSTKLGFAGEDYPRSYFRSTTAIHRDAKHKSDPRKVKRSYDFFSRPLDHTGDDDGNWEVSNPVDATTGLIFQGMNNNVHYSSSLSNGHDGVGSGTDTETEKPSSSMNANEEIDDAEVKDASSPNESSSGSQSSDNGIIPGECFTHFSSHLAHGYESALCTDAASTPLMLVEKSYNPPPIRQKMMEIVFEEHNVPATFFARDAVCACYAVGRTTGTVADVGHAGTVVTPVYDGFVETKGILRSPVGGAMMGEMTLQHLDGLYKTKKSRMKLKSPVDYIMPLYQVNAEGMMARREPFHSLARLDLARLCKEDGTGAGVAGYGYAALSDLEGDAAQKEPSDMYHQYANAPKATYKLPDGTTIDISQTKRFDVGELMFGKGGKSAQTREDATRRAKKRLDAITTSGGDLADNEDVESNAIAHMEEIARRKRNARGLGENDKKKLSFQASHEKLVNACIPYLSTTIGEFTASSLPSMICESAFKCDRDQQSQLLGNTVLCGGGACLATSVMSTSTGVNDGNAMPERLRRECEAIIHAHTPGWRVKVSSPGISERAICSWLGASILGSLGTFHEMWITKAEYEEHGASIINRKCP